MISIIAKWGNLATQLQLWNRIHIDYAGPIEGKMVLVVIDAHSKWIEAIPLNRATALTTIQQLRKLLREVASADQEGVAILAAKDSMKDGMVQL